MRCIGIDPGINGAAAVYDTAAPRRVEVFDFPIIGDEATKTLDVFALHRWIRDAAADNAFVERAMAMPSFGGPGVERRSMGAASAFKFGEGYGLIKACVILAGLPVRFIMPGVWKKSYGLKGGDGAKELARQRALELFPESSVNLARKKDHQRAEAGLVAKYGATMLASRG